MMLWELIVKASVTNYSTIDILKFHLLKWLSFPDGERMMEYLSTCSSFERKISWGIGHSCLLFSWSSSTVWESFMHLRAGVSDHPAKEVCSIQWQLTPPQDNLCCHAFQKAVGKAKWLTKLIAFNNYFFILFAACWILKNSLFFVFSVCWVCKVSIMTAIISWVLVAQPTWMVNGPLKFQQRLDKQCLCKAMKQRWKVHL